MANIIDALFITLGLDTREYQKSQKEVGASLKKLGETSDKQTKLIAESGKKAAGAFSALKIEILGALAAFGMGSGFKAFIESSMDMQVAAGRQATALGVSVNSLQVWKQMAREMGESGDAAVGTLSAVSQGIANARQGNMEWFNTAQRLGVKGLSINDSTDDAMEKIAQAAYLIKQKYGGAQAVNFLGQLGISDLAQQTMMMKGAAGLEAGRAHAKEHSVQLTQQQIDQNNKLLQQWGDLLGDFDKIKVKLENKLLPIVIKLGKEFENWLNGVDWDSVIDKIGNFLGQLNKVIDALGGVKGILIEIAAIKVFGWVTSIAGWVIKLKSLTTALNAAKLAAAGGGAVPAVAEGAGAGLASRTVPFLTRISMWALPIWALFHSESTGGKKRADGTYEDEVDWNSPEQQAGIARQKAARNKDIDQTFSRLEQENGLPSGLLSSIYSAESSRGKNLVSPKGAKGPFQFMPDTAADYGLQGSDVFDLNKSASAAASYLHDLMKMFNGNLQDAVAAYNWGPGNVMRNGLMSMPKETSDYLQRVLGALPVGARAGSGAGPTTNTNTVTINGPINVQTKATDANGVAKGMGKALRSNPLINGYVTSAA